MTDFETGLNALLVGAFNNILKYEARSLQNISENPVTISEAHMLEYIAKQEGEATVSGIAADLQLAVPTATVAVKKLERKGYVTKAPCAGDGRRAHICLTENGSRVNRAHAIFHQRMVRSIARQFGEAEKEILLAVIKKLGDFFENKQGLAVGV